LSCLPLLALATAAGCGQEGRVRENASSTGDGGAGAGGSGAGGVGGGAPKDPQTVKVFNWNVHNFLNDKDDTPLAGEIVVTTAEYTTHRSAIGKVIAAEDPDIAVMAEVENVETLTDLVMTELGGQYPNIALVDGNDPRGIDIGIISKLPIDKVVTHKDDSFPLYGTAGPKYQFSRDCPEYHLTVNGRKVVLLGAHLKAKSNDDPQKRLAEAQRTRVIADALAKEDPSRAILVLGDFNDTPDSPPYLAVIGKDPTKYTNAPALLPLTDRYSFVFQGKYELIDQQMSNPLLAEMLDPTTVKIRHTTDVYAASDHDPVMATYLIR